jgi:ATP-binding cassette, subfamily C (CFTR/MRP), member 1
MVETSHGSITIDGVDLATIPRQRIRSRLIGVPQDSYLLQGTVRFNIDPNGTVPDEAIENALKSVQLWKIVTTKGGLNADVNELFLSHGQKQLFCLARAMVRPSTILVLDEATSRYVTVFINIETSLLTLASVDGKTDELMQKIIRQKFANHTIIAVAHKLETILDFDKVVLLEAGAVKEIGSPHDLLSKESSEFSKLYHNLHSSKKMETNEDEITNSTKA